MKTLLKTVLVVSLFAMGFILISLVTLRWLFPDPYDRQSADFKYIESALASERKVLALDNFNSGDWQFLCVMGPYNDPVKILRNEAQRRGIEINTVDVVPYEPLGLGQGQAAVSFVDSQRRGLTVLFPGAFRLAGEHARKCYGPEVKEIALPMNEIER